MTTAMAKSSVFDRADALRRGGPTEASTGTTPTASPVVRRRGKSAAAAPEVVETPSAATTPTIRRRRRAAPEPVAAEVAAPATTASAIVRRRPAVEPTPPPAPEPVIDLPAPPEPVVAKEPEPVVAVPEPEPEPEPVVAAPEPEPEPTPVVAQQAEEIAAVADPAPVEPVAEVAAEPAPVVTDAPETPDASAASLDDLLGAPAKGKRHAVLSTAEIAADEARQRGDVPAAEPVADEPVAAEPVALVVTEATPEQAAAMVKGEAQKDLSLEALLRQQGIVQHKPKKGRRIIEDDLTQQTIALAEPQPKPPPGVSLYEDKKPRGPVRFLDPAALLRERQGRAKQAQAAPDNKRKGRKSVVARRDALYGTQASRRRTRRNTKSGMPIVTTTPAAHKRIVQVDENIRVSAFAHELGVKGGQVIKALINMGQMVTLNELIDLETAQLLAEEFGFTVENATFNEGEFIEGVEEATVDEEAEPRPAVITIMGHVDHGKTTLLDAIRSARVADGEAGGITQHISAFHVSVRDQKITFVDTPGHAAFTAMRARGASVTDIVVLVIAATEGVMPQTEEVIAHAKAAGVPVIVAINKVDLPESNPDRARTQLSEHNLIPEAWGGDVQMIEVSAKEGTGLSDLLDAILLQADMLELKANPNRPAFARVVEAQLEKGRGPVATVLVQAGTLRPGQVVVAGIEHGRVRAMLDESGKRVKEAGPSIPVSILGLSGLPNAGDELAVVENDRAAKALVENRKDLAREAREAVGSRMSLEDAFKRLKEGEKKTLNLIVKADVRGSVEALKHAFTEIDVAETEINILHAGVGGVTEGDITLASAAEGIVIGFGVRPDAKARRLAEREGVDVRTYRVIYEAVDELKRALVGLLDPIFKETVVGHAEVRELFKVPKIGMIAGCSVQDGKIGRTHSARLLRNSIVVWEGKLGSLRRFKDDVKEVLQGYECGIGLEGYDDLKAEDVIETYMVEEVEREI
jgi:translation initiation factor IF-2